MSFTGQSPAQLAPCSGAVCPSCPLSAWCGWLACYLMQPLSRPSAHHTPPPLGLSNPRYPPGGDVSVARSDCSRVTTMTCTSVRIGWGGVCVGGRGGVQILLSSRSSRVLLHFRTGAATSSWFPLTCAQVRSERGKNAGRMGTSSALDLS